MPFKHSSYELTQEKLKELIDYDPINGTFIWKSTRLKGLSCGDLDSYEYTRITIFNKPYKGHRLAWFIMTGAWPKIDIDHKDGNPQNNKFDNLRECTETQNLGNQKRSKTNTSGVKGVSWDKLTNMWRVNICYKKKIKNLGRYSTLEQAAAAYEKAAKELFGEFARLK